MMETDMETEILELYHFQKSIFSETRTSETPEFRLQMPDARALWDAGRRKNLAQEADAKMLQDAGRQKYLPQDAGRHWKMAQDAGRKTIIRPPYWVVLGVYPRWEVFRCMTSAKWKLGIH